MFGQIRDFVSRNKVRFSRGYSYISIFAIPLLVVDVFERRFPKIPFLLAYITVIIGILVMGYIDDKLGFLNSEQSFTTIKNKVLMEILDKK